MLTFLLGAFSMSVRAQGIGNLPATGPIATEAPTTAGTPGAIAGNVRDSHGDPVAGATIKLVGGEKRIAHTVTTNGDGAFVLTNLPPGSYQLQIDSDISGEQSLWVDVLLAAGERREVPIIGRRIASTSTTVQVIAAPGEIGQAQVKQQETQRLLGVIPNFYSSYIWDAAPMTSKLKFKLALRSNTDPVTFLIVAALAGVEQQHKTFPGYGQGMEGYAKRLGGAYADTLTGKMISRAILPAIFHQDPRYFYRGSGSVRSRIFYALSSAVICRGDNGTLEPNYSQVLGNFAASGISNLYRAPGDRTAALTFRNGLVMTASAAVENLVREFVSRKLTPNVPAFANGKP